mgnify:CR=1 FL=1
MDSIEKLKDMIASSENIVFFGGAGVSTESGIPDFRSADGIYSRDAVIPPERILSHTFFINHTAEFFDFYKSNMIFPDAKPNAAHLALASLESDGKLRAVVTQNIDGLHQAAGSKRVFELHGSVHRNHCMECGRFFDAAYIMNSYGIPRCDVCGGVVKPDVVLYEEGLDNQTMEDAVSFIRQADVLIIGGTSLAVYPAAGLIDYYKGDKLILVNKSATPMDGRADLLVQGAIGEIFSQLEV